MPSFIKTSARVAFAFGAFVLAASIAEVAWADEPGNDLAARATAETRSHFTWSVEAKAHLRDSEEHRFKLNFPFDPAMLPIGETSGFLETVDAGTHAEISTVTLRLDAAWARKFSFGAKIDLVDRHERNPTSSDREVDVDELWLRYGHETDTATLPDDPGFYVKLGKFPAFERQDDRHLESYGLVSTAFNRLEDAGVELGFDLGRHAYLKASYTQGNPVFLRDPNALAGDNGIPELWQANPDPELKTGFSIPYDADIEDLDFDNPELGVGFGLRFADASGRNGVEVLVWGRERQLAETVDMGGSFYGGDLDLLRGPLNLEPFSFPITSDDKREVGANLWLYHGGLSIFAQFVDQDLAGLDREAFEVEGAWKFRLPVKWAVGGRQLFTYIAPAVRFSRLEPDFAIPSQTPSPSFGWPWNKLDLGFRLGILPGFDLTAELADNEFELVSGAKLSYDEFLLTLRYLR